MRKRLMISVMLCAVFMLSACSSGVKQEDYDALESERNALQSEQASLQSEQASLQSEYDQAESDLQGKKDDYDALKSEYDSYKESMGEYEGLAVAEAEARKIAAESLAAAEAEAKAQAEAEAQAQKEAEEKAGYETGITYEQLARTPEDYTGKKIKFKGKVIQVLEGTDSTEIRLAVGSDYNTILYGIYDSSIVSSRVLEDDVITIYGTSAGLLSYTSTMGGTITIPSALIDKIEQ